MRVAILHNAVAENAAPGDRDVLVQAAAVGQALKQLGHEVQTLPCTLDLDALRARLVRICPAVVFNLVESLGGGDRLAASVPLLLDVLQIPYTGSAGETLALSSHKLLAKEWLTLAALPTPEQATLATLAEGAGGLPFPESYLVKSIAEHASFGLGDESLQWCATAEELAAHLAAQAARLGRPVFAERFISGREFNLSLLATPEGVQVLPPAEILFVDFPPEKPKVVGYRAKWEETSHEYSHTPRQFEFPAADAELLATLANLARRCWRHLGVRDYARVDFRVHESGQPFVLEVNANPCLSPDAGFCAALSQAGIPFAEAVCHILNAALARSRVP